MSDQGHEPDISRVRAHLWTLTGLAFTLVVIFLALGGWMHWHYRDLASESVTTMRPPSSPGPLDELPEIRRRLYGEQRDRLDSYGWVDKEQRIVHVPIGEAMRIVAENGRPEFKDADGVNKP